MLRQFWCKLTDDCRRNLTGALNHALPLSLDRLDPVVHSRGHCHGDRDDRAGDKTMISISHWGMFPLPDTIYQRLNFGPELI